MLTIPGWGLWLMLVASAVGTFLLFMQLRALHWKAV